MDHTVPSTSSLSETLNLECQVQSNSIGDGLVSQNAESNLTLHCCSDDANKIVQHENGDEASEKKRTKIHPLGEDSIKNIPFLETNGSKTTIANEECSNVERKPCLDLKHSSFVIVDRCNESLDPRLKLDIKHCERKISLEILKWETEAHKEVVNNLEQIKELEANSKDTLARDKNKNLLELPKQNPKKKFDPKLVSSSIKIKEYQKSKTRPAGNSWMGALKTFRINKNKPIIKDKNSIILRDKSVIRRHYKGPVSEFCCYVSLSRICSFNNNNKSSMDGTDDINLLATIDTKQSYLSLMDKKVETTPNQICEKNKTNKTECQSNEATPKKIVENQENSIERRFLQKYHVDEKSPNTSKNKNKPKCIVPTPKSDEIDKNILFSPKTDIKKKLYDACTDSYHDLDRLTFRSGTKCNVDNLKKKQLTDLFGDDLSDLGTAEKDAESSSKNMKRRMSVSCEDSKIPIKIGARRKTLACTISLEDEGPKNSPSNHEIMRFYPPKKRAVPTDLIDKSEMDKDKPDITSHPENSNLIQQNIKKDKANPSPKIPKVPERSPKRPQPHEPFDSRKRRKNSEDARRENVDVSSSNPQQDLTKKIQMLNTEQELIKKYVGKDKLTIDINDKTESSKREDVASQKIKIDIQKPNIESNVTKNAEQSAQPNENKQLNKTNKSREDKMETHKQRNVNDDEQKKQTIIKVDKNNYEQESIEKITEEILYGGASLNVIHIEETETRTGNSCDDILNILNDSSITLIDKETNKISQNIKQTETTIVSENEVNNNLESPKNNTNSTFFALPETLVDELVEAASNLKVDPQNYQKATSKFILFEDLFQLNNLENDRVRIVNPYIDLTAEDEHFDNFCNVLITNISTEVSHFVKSEEVIQTETNCNDIIIVEELKEGVISTLEKIEEEEVKVMTFEEIENVAEQSIVCDYLHEATCYSVNVQFHTSDDQVLNNTQVASNLRPPLTREQLLNITEVFYHEVFEILKGYTFLKKHYEKTFESIQKTLQTTPNRYILISTEKEVISSIIRNKRNIYSYYLFTLVNKVPESVASTIFRMYMAKIFHHDPVISYKIIMTLYEFVNNNQYTCNDGSFSKFKTALQDGYTEIVNRNTAAIMTENQRHIIKQQIQKYLELTRRNPIKPTTHTSHISGKARIPAPPLNVLIAHPNNTNSNTFYTQGRIMGCAQSPYAMRAPPNVTVTHPELYSLSRTVERVIENCLPNTRSTLSSRMHNITQAATSQLCNQTPSTRENIRMAQPSIPNVPKPTETGSSVTRPVSLNPPASRPPVQPAVVLKVPDPSTDARVPAKENQPTVTSSEPHTLLRKLLFSVGDVSIFQAAETPTSSDKPVPEAKQTVSIVPEIANKEGVDVVDLTLETGKENKSTIFNRDFVDLTLPDIKKETEQSQNLVTSTSNDESNDLEVLEDVKSQIVKDLNVKEEDKQLKPDDEIIDLTWLDDVPLKEELLDNVDVVKTDGHEDMVSPTPDESNEVENAAYQNQYISDRNILDNRQCFCGKTAEYLCYCSTVMYCSRECQIYHWGQHQKTCSSTMYLTQ